jgi:hypothetical protein
MDQGPHTAHGGGVQRNAKREVLVCVGKSSREDETKVKSTLQQTLNLEK